MTDNGRQPVEDQQLREERAKTERISMRLQAEIQELQGQIDQRQAALMQVKGEWIALGRLLGEIEPLEEAVPVAEVPAEPEELQVP